MSNLDYTYAPSKYFDVPWQGIAVVVNRSVSGGTFRSVSEARNENDFGYRVQVRVLGEHPADKVLLRDDELPWAIVDNSVNLGSSGGTPQIHGGDTVGGYIRNRNYHITWVGVNPGKIDLGFNQSLSNGFSPFLEKPYQVPNFSIDGGSFRPTWDAFRIGYLSDILRGDEKSDEVPCPDEILNAPAIITEIDKLIQKVENIKKLVGVGTSVKEITGYIISETDRIEADILNAIKATSKKVAEKIAGLIKWVQEQVTFRVNQIGRVVASNVPINARFKIREGTNIFVEAIYCLFNKILDGLVRVIADFLENAIDQFINTPLCAIKNMLTGLLGTIFATLSGMISDLANQISGFADVASELVNSVLDTITAALEVFKCEPEDECPETKVWNILDASSDATQFSPISIDIEDVVEKAKAVEDSYNEFVKFIYDENGNFLGVDILDFIFDITNSLNDFSCNGQPVFCGPPKVVFWGGGGSGATGNAIIDNLGQIIGVDIITPGSGYIREPYVSIVDDCGIGRGVVAQSEIGPIDPEQNFSIPEIIFEPPKNPSDDRVTEDPKDPQDPEKEIPDTEIQDPSKECPTPGFTNRTSSRTPTPNYDNYGVTGVIIKERGTGFRTNYDGSLGGRGRVWAGSDQTYVRRSNGVYVLPISPGETINVNKCDQVVPPNRIPYQVRTDGVLTAEPKDQTSPIIENSLLDNGKYPVILYLCGLRILNSGISYKDTDKIKVVPDNGAKIEAKFNNVGALIGIDIIDRGSEITGSVDIVIESDTGFNAVIVPIICTDKPTGDVSIPTIDVIDCVGKI